MPSPTLSSIRDQIRRLGDYERSNVFTNAFLLEWINKGLEAYHELVLDAHEGYYDQLDETLVTAAGNAFVSLPATFLRLRLLERKDGTDDYSELRRIALVETSRFKGRGSPRGYMLSSAGDADGLGSGVLPGRIRLFPTPDAVYTLRATFVPVAGQLSADADVYAFLPGGDVFVIYWTLIALAASDKIAPAEWQAQMEGAARRVKAAAKQRDEGEPEYLIPRGAGGWSEEDG